MESTDPPRPKRTAFLLSQLGALASARFAERTRELGLTPSDAGVLRLLGRSPGLSQRSLADRLGAVPKVLGALRGIAERHEAELLAPLTSEQSAQLGILLARLASAHALDTDLHRDTRPE
jgi:hypothetical protein